LAQEQQRSAKAHKAQTCRFECWTFSNWRSDRPIYQKACFYQSYTEQYPFPERLIPFSFMLSHLLDHSPFFLPPRLGLINVVRTFPKLEFVKVVGSAVVDALGSELEYVTASPIALFTRILCKI
jgi:hypothetical protein